MRKKIMFFLILIVLFLVILMFIMIGLDNKYNNNLYATLIKNTDVNKISYVNKYDNHYIVMDDKNLYLFNNDYVEIVRIDLSLMHKNDKNYDIVYMKDNLFYMNDYKNDDGVVFEYYDIYEYKLVDKIIVGGK